MKKMYLTIAILIFIATFINFASSEILPSYSLGLQNVSARIYGGNATVMFVGDSITAQNSHPRVSFYGAIREWKPQYWKGYYISKAQGAEEASSAFNCPTAGTPATVTTLNAGEVYPDGSQGWNVMATTAFNFTADIGAGSVGCRYILDYSHFADWFQDWSNNASLFTRYHYVGTNRTTPWAFYREYRNGTTDFNPGTLIFFNTTTTNSTWVQGLNFTPSTGSSAYLGQNLISGAWNESSTNLTNYYPLGMRLYRSDVPYGFQLGYAGDGGWNTDKHMGINATLNYSDQGLRTYMQVNEANVFVIWLGVNVGTNEWNGSNAGNYQGNIASIINRYTRVYYTQNTTSDKPYFILVSNWDIQDSDVRMAAFERALVNITKSQTNYSNLAVNASIAVINLRNKINDTNGSWSGWQGSYTSDGTHENAAGSIQFARYLWEEINKSIIPFKGKSGSLNFTTQSYTLWNKTIDTNSILFNNTDIYRQQVNLTNLTNVLIYDENLTAICQSTSNCSIDSNVTVRNQSIVYVLDNFNITENVVRNFSPLWYSNATSSFKSIASNLTTTLNASVIFNVTNCNIERIYYVSHAGNFQYNYSGNQFSCNSEKAFIANVPLETASGSNNFTITYSSENVNVTHSVPNGGTGGGTFEPKTNEASEIDFIKGYTWKLSLGDNIKFNVREQTYILTLKSFTTKTAIVIIESNPILIKLELDTPIKLNINRDKIDDIILEYEGISAGAANIFIKKIEYASEAKPVESKQPESQLSPLLSGKKLPSIILVAAIFLIFILIIILVSKKKRKSKKHRHH